MASAAEACGREAARTSSNGGRKRLTQWVAVAGLAMVLASHSALAQWQETHAFVVNASDSLPNWAFFIHDDKSPDRGDYVFFTPPKEPVARHPFRQGLRVRSASVRSACRGTWSPTMARSCASTGPWSVA